MNEKQFVAKRQEDWARFSVLVAKSETSINSLSGAEIREFGKLYRRVAGDLAQVRTLSENPQLQRYLNDLVARAHGELYRHPRRSFWQGFLNMVLEAASAVRRRQVFIYISIALTLGSAIFAHQAVVANPKNLQAFVPPGFGEALENWKEKKFKDVDSQSAIAGTGFYLMNNSRVTILVVAGGLTFGVLTVYLIFTNGAILGAFAHELARVGGLGHFLVGISAHGVSELGGIFIGSAAGLLLGWSMVNPGRLTRTQSIRLASKDAMYLLGIGLVMIWVAAPIEAWISFGNSVPDGMKLAFAGLTLVGWLSLFTFGGRPQKGIEKQAREQFMQPRHLSQR